MRLWLVRLALALLAIMVLGASGIYAVLRASLPVVSGQRSVAGLSGEVRIERDALGIPTVSGRTRADVALATGFLHAQERFFQMDLLRRLPAAELAGLFGEAAAPQDEKARTFRFRDVARDVLRRAAPEERAVLGAYTRGVNAGLEALGSRPWEYWLLGRRPEPWRDEDVILVVHAMWWDLQYGELALELTRRRIDERVGGPICPSGWKCVTEFLHPAHTEWDAPNSIAPGGRAPARPMSPPPPPGHFDLRSRGTGERAPGASRRAQPRGFIPGSNNWAVAGAHTASGAALVANDMHLGLRVPPIWYRARLRVLGSGGEPALDLNGVTLPGAPPLVAGSNRRIAWGFTNVAGDFLDLERTECKATDAVRVAQDAGGCWTAHWLAALPEATNLRLLDLERAGSVAEALALAPEIGIPHENLVVGDREGSIAWTIIGRLPAATGAGRNRAAGGWLEADAHPRLLDPPAGRVWSANARSTDRPEEETAIGGDEVAVGAGYALGARARQIREALLALDGPATPADMLRIQTDDRALFLERWRALALRLLDAAALEGRAERADFRALIERWEPRASAGSVGYALVRAFRRETEVETWTRILTALEIDPGDSQPPEQFEGALWQLVSAEPLHWLPGEYGSWREYLLERIDRAIVELNDACGALERCSWAAYRRAAVRHPLSAALPDWIARFLDMPETALDGDTDMPRVQGRAFGASERFAVSPGQEEEGYLHLPGGQSGHPLSPWYRAGFEAWARGEPLPFLPGPTRERLFLRPERTRR